MLLVIISHQLIEYILGEHWPPNQLQYLLIGQKHVHWCISPRDLDESACNERDLGSIPGSGRSLEEGNSYPLQYSCLENSMDRGAWWAIVHGVTESHMTEQLIFSLSKTATRQIIILTSDMEKLHKSRKKNEIWWLSHMTKEMCRRWCLTFFGNDFLDITLKAHTTAKITKGNYLKIRAYPKQ